MKVLVSGSSGLVGGALVRRLESEGHAVVRLARAGQGLAWDPERGVIDKAGLEGFDAVVHLAGESIASGRWTESRKKRILDSRVKGTGLLSETLAALRTPPKVLLTASAVGFYGDRGEEVLDEEASSGDLFLSEVCRRWEEAAAPAARAGVRVVNTRFGVILSPAGGALAKMLTPFRLGLGGRIGTGRQYMSWITLDDVVGAVEHLLEREPLRGPVNVVAPRPATNEEFTRTLGRALHRPTVFPMPAAVARLAFGQMADELLLASARVKPARLEKSGYTFLHPGLDEALKSLLG